VKEAKLWVMRSMAHVKLLICHRVAELPYVKKQLFVMGQEIIFNFKFSINSDQIGVKFQFLKSKIQSCFEFGNYLEFGI